VIAFPGISLLPECLTYFLSKDALNSIDYLDETLIQMASFVDQNNPSKIIAIIPVRYRLDIMHYLEDKSDRIQFLDPE